MINDKIKSGVYIIEDINRSTDTHLFVKVGMSNKNIDKRILQVKKELNFCGIDSNIKVFTKIYCRQALKCEQLLHKILSIYRVNNYSENKKSEWFKVPESKLNEKLMLINTELHRFK